MKLVGFDALCSPLAPFLIQLALNFNLKSGGAEVRKAEHVQRQFLWKNDWFLVDFQAGSMWGVKPDSLQQSN